MNPTVSDVEAGPYRAKTTGQGDYAVIGPYLTGWLCPRIEVARDVALLLNLAYAAGKNAGLTHADEILADIGGGHNADCD